MKSLFFSLLVAKRNKGDSLASIMASTESAMTVYISILPHCMSRKRDFNKMFTNERMGIDTMLTQTRSQRIRDTRIELESWMAERAKRGNGPPESAGPGVMSESDLSAYFNRSRETMQTDVRGVPRMQLGKIRYYTIRDIAAWMVQKEEESSI